MNLNRGPISGEQALKISERMAEDTSTCRGLEELKRSTGILKGLEAQRLRTFCTGEMMTTGDLDPFGRMIFAGDLEGVKSSIKSRIDRLSMNLTESEKLETVAKELQAIRYGPTEVPIIGCIGLCLMLNPTGRQSHLKILHYITITFSSVCPSKINLIDTPDLSGTTALSHAISTKPQFDLEFAQILFNAGANVNARNRYGATAGHAFCLVWELNDRKIVQRARDAMQWFLTHGGNMDIADGDGMKPRTMAVRVRKGMDQTLRDGDILRLKRAGEMNGGKLENCLACGGNEKLMVCSKCKKAKYCGPPRACQKADWAKHKGECGKHGKDGEKPASTNAKPPVQVKAKYLGQDIV